MDYKNQKPPYVDPREHKGEQVKEFLRKMGLIESSGGIDTDHPTMQTGMHAGTHAVGEYGLMPLTAQDLDKRAGGGDNLQDLDKPELQERLNTDPDLVNRLVQSMASNMLNKNDTETAAYKWEHGPAAEVNDDILNNSPRIKKFRALKNLK